MATPCGPFTIVMDDDAVIASGWTTSTDELMETVSSSLRPTTITAARDLGEVSRAVARYFEGDLLAIDAHRSASSTRVRSSSTRGTCCARFPPASPITYAELAAKVGRPDAVRAAANACAFNAAALFVPCHRVVRTGPAYERRSAASAGVCR